MRSIYFLFLIFVLQVQADSVDLNKKYLNDNKLGVFDIYYKYDYWSDSFYPKLNDEQIMPKQKITGHKHYLDIKANILNTLTVEKHFTSSNYDYLNIHPSGILGVYMGYSYYKKDTYKKQWVGLMSGLLSYETQDYKTDIDGVSYKVEKKKYGAIFSEGVKNWFDFFLEYRDYMHTGIANKCNFGFFNYCVGKESAFILLPAGDFYYLKAKYKTSDESLNIDTDGFGVDFGVKFYYDHYLFNKNLFLGMQGRYVYGSETLHTNDESDDLNDIIRDYYINLFLDFRFGI